MRIGIFFATLALVAGCQPRPEFLSSSEDCQSATPSKGDVVVGPVTCDAQQIPSGEGRGSDYYLANHHFRAIIRHPETSLSMIGVDGGTLIDAAPWGYRDRLHEALPLVGGGWLDVDVFEVGDSEILVGGTVVSLPDQLAEEAGA